MSAPEACSFFQKKKLQRHVEYIWATWKYVWNTRVLILRLSRVPGAKESYAYGRRWCQRPHSTRVDTDPLIRSVSLRIGSPFQPVAVDGDHVHAVIKPSACWAKLAVVFHVGRALRVLAVHTFFFHSRASFSLRGVKFQGSYRIFYRILERDVWILIKKLITELAGKLWDEFIKTN
jgi:hypothetical protein